MKAVANVRMADDKFEMLEEHQVAVQNMHGTPVKLGRDSPVARLVGGDRRRPMGR